MDKPCIGNFYINKHVNKKFKNKHGNSSVTWAELMDKYWIGNNCRRCGLWVEYCACFEKPVATKIISKARRRMLKKDIEMELKYDEFIIHDEEDQFEQLYICADMIKICKFVSRNAACPYGDDCKFRHKIYPITLEIDLLPALHVKYCKDKLTDNVIFSVLLQNGGYYETSNVKQLLQYLLHHCLWYMIARLVLFIDDKTSYSNDKWYKWIARNYIKFDGLFRAQQIQIIIKLHELINYYHLNWKYIIMKKEFWPLNYFKQKVLFDGFFLSIIRQTMQNEHYPQEIIKLCLQFYESSHNVNLVQ
eukprot:517670_1